MIPALVVHYKGIQHSMIVQQGAHTETKKMKKASSTNFKSALSECNGCDSTAVPQVTVARAIAACSADLR